MRLGAAHSREKQAGAQSNALRKAVNALAGAAREGNPGQWENSSLA